MKKLKILLALSGIVLITTALQATNNQDSVCVHSYNSMNKYVDKVIVNEKLPSNKISLKIHSDLAMTHATETVIDCIFVRPELSYKAQENYDELVAIEQAVKYAKEYAEIEAKLERVLAEV